MKMSINISSVPIHKLRYSHIGGHSLGYFGSVRANRIRASTERDNVLANDTALTETTHSIEDGLDQVRVIYNWAPTSN